MQYAINKKPCAYPIAIVASGISQMYFSGIATPISNKNEVPSRNPISLNLPILLDNKFTILIYIIIPAPTVLLVASSIKIKLPVFLFLLYWSINKGEVVRKVTLAISLLEITLSASFL